MKRSLPTSNGESLEFAVTFRLDQKQLDFVNETFREILNNRDGQVRFVELQPRPKILPGKVIRVPLVAKELLPEGKKLKDYQKARIEAEYLARWIKERRTEKTFGRFVAGGGDPLSAQSLAANDGRSVTARRFAGVDPI